MPSAARPVTDPRPVAPKPTTAASQPAPVIAGHPGELEGVDDGAVAGQLVVLVEDVEVERAVAAPMVHLLPGDQRQPALDGDLGDLLVLHAVHPSPEHGALGQLEQVRRHRLRDAATRRTSRPADRVSAGRRPAAPGPRRRSRTARRSHARGRGAVRTSSSMEPRCRGWIGRRRSFSLRDPPGTPRVSSSIAARERIKGRPARRRLGPAAASAEPCLGALEPFPDTGDARRPELADAGDGVEVEDVGQ